MPPIPNECLAEDAEVKRLEALIDALVHDLSQEDLEPGEPGLSSAQKAALGAQITSASGKLRIAQHALTECERRVNPPDPETQPSLSVLAIHVVQSIQTPGNGIRLVRNKPAAVRVFVASGIDNGFDNGAGPNRWPNVSGELRVTDAAGFTTGPLSPFNQNGAIVAQPEAEVSEDDGSHTLNFRLPLAAVSTDELRIDARVYVRGHESDGAGWTADGTTTVQFVERRSQEVTPVLIGDGPAGLPPPTMAQFVSILRRGALARFPIPSFAANPPFTFTTFLPLTSLFGWAGLLSQLATVITIGRPSGGIRAGVVNFSPGHVLGGIGLPRLLITAPAFISTVASESTFAHEMGHTHALNHSRCTMTEPIFWDDRLPGRTNATGMHVEDGVVIPRGSSEIMSYCPDPGWPSVQAYNLIFDNPV